jgi:hypothetical protein
MHNWKTKNKFKSNPCENLKKILQNRGISFIEEYPSPVENRKFKIDIAFPDKKIGIEVNGNQHYDKNGNLKNYYQDRHNLIEREGWKIYEVHYSCCYNEKLMIPIILEILDSPIKLVFNYINYIPKDKLPKYCKCGEQIYKYSASCRKCVNKGKCKIKWPSKEELSLLLWQKPTSILAKELGVSDSAIGKRCRLLHISKPKRGYWEKVFHSKVGHGGIEPPLQR